jgi:DNA-binding CsgD family transcriptional regulator
MPQYLRKFIPLYNMHYLIYLVFILSVAIAAGGVILSSRLRDKYHHEVFSTLLYFQVFIYTFGFYAIWGQVIINAFLKAYISGDILTRISEISLLLGLPFLVFAWLMLLNLSSGLSGIRNRSRFVFWFLLFNISTIILIGYFITRTNDLTPVSLIKHYFIVMNFLYTFLASSFILLQKKNSSIINGKERRIISSSLILIMIVQSVPLLFDTSEVYTALIFIFIFFMGNIFLPVYLNYGVLITLKSDEPKKELSLGEFCRRYEVSPRETDIIREICNGLSNQEISEKLFISLQTVKDHSHRIYIKTNVRSRVQLINLVKEVTGT